MPNQISATANYFAPIMASGKVKVADLESWAADVKKTHEGKLHKIDLAVLESLLFEHAKQLTPATTTHVAEMIAANRKRVGYNSLSIRLAGMQRADDQWPVDSTPNCLKLDTDLPLEGRYGDVVRVGSTGIQNNRLQIRRVVTSDKKEALEAHVEFHPRANKKVVREMLKAGACFNDYVEETAVVDTQGRLRFQADKLNDGQSASSFSYSNSRSGDIECSLTLETQQFRVDYFPEEISEQALRGVMRVRAFGDTKAIQRKNLAKGLAAAGAEEALVPCDTKQRRRHMKMRVLWQSDPQAALVLGADSRLSDKKIDAALEKAKVPPEFIHEVRYSEVFPGYFTAVVPSMHERYKAAGVEGIIHSTRRSENVVKTILAGGLLSTSERLFRGVHAEGLSSNTDLNTGGADYVFTRMVLGQHGRSKVDNFGGFVFVMKPKILDRTDWFAYPTDKFGTTNVTGGRGKPTKALSEAYLKWLKESGKRVPAASSNLELFFQKLHHDHRTGTYEKRTTGRELVHTIRDTGSSATRNEVMFRTGIPLCDIDHVVVNSDEKRQAVVEGLKAAGVKKINGKRASSFIKVRDTVLPQVEAPHDGYYI